MPSPHCASEAAAAEVAAEQQQHRQQCPDGEAADEGLQAAGGGAAPPPFGVPTGLVKKIMLVDDEVQRMSADAVRAIAKATELFVQQLAVRALQHAQAAKRKNFKAPDVAHLAGRDRCGEDKCRMLQRVSSMLPGRPASPALPAALCACMRFASASHCRLP